MALDQNAKLFGHFMALRLVVQDMLKRQAIDAEDFDAFLSETQASVVADLHALDLKKGASKAARKLRRMSRRRLTRSLRRSGRCGTSRPRLF